MATLKPFLEKLIARQDLTHAEASAAMEIIATGRSTEVQTSAFLVLLRSKGETTEEISGMVKVMRKHSAPVPVPPADLLSLLDIVGTGGDEAYTVNLSTTAAILAAACGAKVAKHGNRSVGSQAGSADVLEVLGVDMLDPEHIVPCLKSTGIAFMFAPKFHPAMCHIMSVQRSLGVRTIFNILGPLLNPAGAQRIILGVFSPHLLSIYGSVLHRLGVEHALVVHCCGLDELAPIGVAKAVEVTSAGVVARDINPMLMGISKCTIADLRGGSKEVNAEILTDVMKGGPGAKGAIADTVALNAGAGLYVAGLCSSIEEGYREALKTLQSGAAFKKLQEWGAKTRELAKGNTAAQQ
jgi:anthranilate phosphoribosyltransferase